MLKTIIQKELLSNIFSFRFLVTFVLLLVIVTITVFILTDNYVKKLDEYSQRQREIENYLGDYAHFNRINNVVRPSQPPVPFYSLIRGLSSDSNIEEFDNDPLPVIFPSLEDRQTLRKITEVILYCQEGLLSQTKVEQFSFSQVLAD